MKKSLVVFLFVFLYLACLSQNAQAQKKEKDTIYKFGDFLIHATDTMKIEFITKGETGKHLQSNMDTLYDGDKYTIMGNSDKLSTYGVYKKFEFSYKFSSFNTPVYKGILAKPNFKTDPPALQFRTQIKNQCRSDGVNFAGHFTLTHWGCGSNCEEIAIVDRINGKIYYSNLISLSNSIFYEVKYKHDSKMIVMNYWLLSDYKGYITCSDTWPLEVASWDNSKFKFLFKSSLNHHHN